MYTIDFETRSLANLAAAGSWAYAEHDSTEIICLAVMHNEKVLGIWYAPKFARMIAASGLSVPFVLLRDTDILLMFGSNEIIEAHNAAFEIGIWEHKMVALGFPRMPLTRWRCSMAKARACALPGSLDGATKAMGSKVKKDMDGKNLMLSMCAPINKNDVKKGAASVWKEDAASLIRLGSYCIDDVRSEHSFSKMCPDLNNTEQELWLIDQEINKRGFKIDVNSVVSIIDMVDKEKARIKDRCKEITNGEVGSPSQVAALINWIAINHGIFFPNLQKETVAELLGNQEDGSEEIKELLYLRQEISKTSVGKYPAMLKALSADGRVQGSFIFCGAGTGRWTAHRVQPHNFPRRKVENADDILKLIQEGRYQDAAQLFGGGVMDMASALLRSVIIPDRGKKFIGSDFSGIEMVVLSCLAGATKRIEAIRDGVDLYKVAAASTMDKKYEDITADERQVGKVEELAFGYRGYWRAFMAFAKVYGLSVPQDIQLSKDPDDLKKQLKDGVNKLTREEARFKLWASPIANKWREDNYEIVQYWYDVEEAAKCAILDPGSAYSAGSGIGTIRFLVHNDFLCLLLPSKRILYYREPKIERVKMPWVNEIEQADGSIIEEPVYKDAITYMSFKQGQWVRVQTHGGKFVENITQAASRDLLAAAFPNLEKEKYPIVLHVHDEVLTEVPEDFGCVESLNFILTKLPMWAKSFPVKAEGWTGHRFKKA